MDRRWCLKVGCCGATDVSSIRLALTLMWRAKAIAAQSAATKLSIEMAKRICMPREKDSKVLQIRAVYSASAQATKVSCPTGRGKGWRCRLPIGMLVLRSGAGQGCRYDLDTLQQLAGFPLASGEASGCTEEDDQSWYNPREEQAARCDRPLERAGLAQLAQGCNRCCISTCTGIGVSRDVWAERSDIVRAEA